MARVSGAMLSEAARWQKIFVRSREYRTVKLGSAGCETGILRGGKPLPTGGFPNSEKRFQ